MNKLSHMVKSLLRLHSKRIYFFIVMKLRIRYKNVYKIKSTTVYMKFCKSKGNNVTFEQKTNLLYKQQNDASCYKYKKNKKK